MGQWEEKREFNFCTTDLSQNSQAWASIKCNTTHLWGILPSSSQPFPFSSFAMCEAFHDDNSPAEPSSSPEGLWDPGAAWSGEEDTGERDEGWWVEVTSSTSPLPMEQGETMCRAWMKPHFPLPAATQGVSTVCLTEMTQVLNADLP